MSDLASLEAAAALVHRRVPPTPQYGWPLLGAAARAEVWVKHENHTPIGAFKVRGGLVYLDALGVFRAGLRGVDHRDPRQSRPEHRLCAARRVSRRRSSCRTATAAKRTPRCGRSAPSWSRRATISRPPRARERRCDGARRLHFVPSFHPPGARRRHVCAGTFRGAADSPRSTCRSGWAPASAA